MVRSPTEANELSNGKGGEHAAIDRAVAPWDLVRDHQAGASEAFETLVAAHTRFLQYLCSKWLRNATGPVSAQDIVNETWYQVLRRIHAGEVPWHRPFTGWIGGICLNVLKSKAFRTESPGTDPDRAAIVAPVSVDVPADVVEQAEIHAAIHECLGELGPRLRETYDLAFDRGLSFVQTAAEFGCSEAYVRQKLVPMVVRQVGECLEARGFAADERPNRGPND